MRYFTIKELCRSSKGEAKGIDNTPPSAAIDNLKKLVDNVLDPLREAYGKPIIVNSGYRSPAVNKLVGGVANSQHLTGEAADITVGSQAANKDLFYKIIKLGLPFDQLIDENNFAWVHVSYSPRHRRQVFSAKK